MIKMYGIKNCDTIKRAQRFLESQGSDFEFIDFRQTPIDAQTLQSFVDSVGLDKLINKRSTTYHNLSSSESKNITLELILKNQTLIKRPVIVTKERVVIGFDKAIYKSLC